ncbi:MAG: N-acetylmuramoyl-L-alanine amidase [Crocinitomix sp.]|nr:N-acetylmuramoyl-L-alanine amidase [Crocinitomix sp.]
MSSKEHNISKAFILCISVFFSTLSFAQVGDAMRGIKTVVIDPGHGGQDPGCHGAHSNEKAVTLAIGLKVGAAIEKAFPEINVVYTRKTDVFIELDERAAIANRNKADLFICIHANAGPAKAIGAETYVLGLHRTDAQRKIAERENSAIEFEADSETRYEKLSADAIIARQLQLSVFLDHSIEFAARIQNEFVALGRENRGVRQAGFLVLYKTTMPSVLIETGFLTNPSEEEFLTDTLSQDAMAGSIFTAFEDYKVYYESADQSTQLEQSEPIDYGIEPEEVPVTADTNKVLYRVQIATTAENISVADARFLGMSVWAYQSNDLHKYTVGLFEDVESAKTLKLEMREKGFENAFVVAFIGNERISIEKAIKLTEN